MDHNLIIHYLVIIIAVFGILLVSKKLTYVKIPLPISLISITFIIYLISPNVIDIHSSEYFDLILLCLLPMVLLPDALKLSWKDLKQHGLSIFYLAVIAVALSISLGVLLKFVIFQEYHLTVGAFVALMAMVLATDAISVTNIFSQFKLPHNLKILTEGESLTNDATAVIAFYVVGLPLMQGERELIHITGHMFEVASLSIIVGLAVGGIAFGLMFIFHKSIEELFLIIMTAYTAFTIAEAFHMSGILAMIVAVVVLKTAILNNIRNFEENPDEVSQDNSFFVNLLKSWNEQYLSKLKDRLFIRATTIEKLKYNEEIIDSFAVLSTAVLFFALAELINIENLILYWKEITIIFIATTIIRALMMLKFAYITNKTTMMYNVNLRWWSVLTFSGIKGGLSIIMVHNLPNSFVHKELFESIVIGVVLLSISLYSIALFGIINKNKEEFRKEYEAELFH